MRRKLKSKKHGKKAKSVLRLPDLEHAKSAVLSSLSNADAQRGYSHAIDEFVDWYCSEPRLAFNRLVVLRYRSHLESRRLAPGTINLWLGAVRRLAYEAADCGLLSADLAAGIRRVRGLRKIGVRLGNWLSAEESRALWEAPDSDRLKGKRDRALLALLLACGLRRHEAVSLRLRDLEQREGRWAIVDLVGKGRHIRTVPIPDWVRVQLDCWITAAQISEGCIFRKVDRSGQVRGEHISEKAVWHIVRKSARRAGRVCRISHHTTCVERVHVCVSLQAASLSKSNFSSDMCRFRPRNVILEASSVCVLRSMTISESSRTCEVRDGIRSGESR